MLKTMAMKITRENHSVVGAIMLNWFLLTPVRDVVGRYIVINIPGLIGDERDRQPTFTYTHSTYTEDEFNKSFAFIRPEISNTFGEVEILGEE